MEVDKAPITENETVKISTREYFESAHRLSDYEEDCKRIHGHNWVVDIFVESSRPLDNVGFLIDFKEIKAAIKTLDHMLLLKDTEENRHICANIPADWIIWFPVNPTCENLSIYIKNVLIGRFGLTPDDTIIVRVYETFKPQKTSFAESEMI